METTKKHTPGSMRVSEDVIIKIAETAACEIDGVDIKGSKSSPIPKRAPVCARILGEAAAIRMDVNIVEGFNAVKVAESVQKSVKSAVQNMTGFTVTKVDVNIMGVCYKDYKDSAEVTE